MAPIVKSSCFVLVLLLNSLILSSCARPLNDAAYSGSAMTQGIEVFLDVLSLEGIKTGGPSSGGQGHAFTDVVTNSSGPSSGGQGHAFTDAVANSGPSSGGQGNAFTDVVAHSGPSSGGDGH